VKLTNTIIPILGSTEQGQPCPVGSGILLGVGKERFLITAAHVLDENKITTLYLPGNAELIELSGQSRQSKPPENNRDLDTLDTAYIHLSGDIVSRINQGYWFLPPQLVDINDISTLGKHYMFTGYPHKALGTAYRTRKIVGQLHSYTDRASDAAVYAEVNANPTSNIAINFDAKRAKDDKGRTVTPKERQGMSGGGVWNFSDGAQLPGLPKIRLCGVAIEHHKKGKCLVATKINFVLESIRFDFPALSQLLPTSMTLEVVVEDKSR
jgi:hypothetical protein